MMNLTALLRSALGALAILMVVALGPAAAQEATEEAAAAVAVTEQGVVDLLIQALEDDAARAELLDRLRQTQEVADGDSPADDVVELLAGEDAAPSEVLSFGRRIALVTQGAAEGLATRAVSVWDRLQQAPEVLSGLEGLSLAIVLQTVGELLMVIVATAAVFLVLRSMAKRLYRRLGAATHEASAARTVGLWILSALIDLSIVIVAWAAGYLIALLALGDFGTIEIRQTLYLNAFLLVETVKVGVRLVLSPSAREMRLLPMGDRVAKRTTRAVNAIVSIAGYGQLLVVPIVNSQTGRVAGSAVTALIALVVLGIAVVMILRNRHRLADWMTGEGGIVRPTGSLSWLARHWHWPVLLYLFAMFIVVLISPPNLVFQSLTTSGQVVLVVLAGVAFSTFLTRVMARGIVVPDDVRARLPLLETRLNRFIPKALFVLRLVIVVFVVLFALDAINLVSLRLWLASQVGLRMTGMFISVALILIAAFAIWVAMTSYVDYRLNPEYGQIATARERTLLTLARNAATIALILITLMFVLSEVGLNIGPLLASAGVLGLAIGFGAQKMVQDIITGVFIQFENAINVGDVITAGGTTGTVERLTIRSVSLRDLSGVFHIIPFSSVDMVSNYMKDFGYYLSDMGVAYRENVLDVKTAMIDAFEELRADAEHGPNIVGDFEWFGVQELADSAVILRARIKCAPGTQWGVGRMYNEVCKRIFDERGIEIPFPHRTLYLGEAKDGTTQTFHVSRRQQIEGEVSDPIPDDRAASPSQDEPLGDES
ncbi:small conductance mechanosensitive channel [Palleronia marisminoris]|uniref:Moderate conductance mechanosensitive channel YbiO n=1 Tax=Palleronia marisminoris TaxID=315423 RepID=A0A1Y5T574_9RHOB|nr:mechanosensitive ion channel domain-containing protein [Palleronia marisminoris]SFH09581.1 small conductance mechanosensitive channel [Palleronia marisminoris]SLN52583.1 Moderate conductance mechanosensitive channel YbiO precursor [Palleronia marisminoris]